MSEAVSAPLSERREPRWSRFDTQWYLLRYPEVRDWMREEGQDDPYTFYLQTGQRYGHSPNRYFDEIWYRDAHKDVRQGLIREEWASGFEHYTAIGYKTHSPHWLFDEPGYRRRYPELTQRFLNEHKFSNGYDHYLEIGESHYYRGHHFFDDELCRELSLTFPDCFDSRIGLFASWLGLPAHVADAGRVSWYFDPVWYLTRYPEVRKEIAAGHYSSALHHYLTNETSRLFDPQEFFSEEFYRQAYPDMAPSLEHGYFRNGYDHFVRYGAQEGRAPQENVDLAAHMAQAQVRNDVRNRLYDSAFAHFVAGRTGLGEKRMAALAAVAEISEEQSRLLFEREAEAILPSLVRHPLDFTVHGVPEISVLMVVYDRVALTAQALASLRANYAGAIQLILVDSGSHDQTRHIGRMVRGATILRYRYNIGYLLGCNLALEKAEAPFVLYLNNDIRLYPDAIVNALKRLRSEAAIGAVGGKLVRTNMRLQEAGSIIWRDGATYGYLREDDPNLTTANFVRDVDYCSAAFLMVRTTLLRRLGGYDPRYTPAYFEDVDLCVRIVKAGMRIVYDPNVVIEHLEFGSSGAAGSHALIQGNLKTFSRLQQDFLRHQQPAHIRNAVLAREHRVSQHKRILFIEDRLPLRRLGSGYVRSNDIINEMTALGYQVTVFPVLPRDQTVIDLFGDFPETVELIVDRDLSSFSDFIQERVGYYDLVWIGRTHNLVRLLPLLNESSRYLPSAGPILDTEVIATPRTLERIRVLDLPEPDISFDEMLQQELDCARFCQQIVAVTSHDADLVRRAGYQNVSVLGHELQIQPTPAPFETRHSILFFGAIHDEGAPNHDSLVWFVDRVLPILDGVLPPDVHFTIAGYVGLDVDMTVFSANSRVEIVGPVGDPRELFDRHRVFVAPTRFAGGIPFKVHEAASYGLPQVVTTLLQEEVGWTDGAEILAAPANDPEAFAAAVERLYQDAELWKTLRAGALAAVERDCSPVHFRQALSGIVQGCIE
ncbi:glycosyltransferase [Gluconobacter sphaericus]|uniref:glycosyltransferase n=1 Tax=Gluconobacter sphaericus TaxID=574987 RepID=UPI001B8B485C|nr:glycosyltransferase [Gluconobacter sphaericus]MBS1085884.1 glycosyltransferase [Gluconobacter sphaericus]MBS1099773.1 glycosyltransferase [Gluconobacter sphaericus]